MDQASPPLALLNLSSEQEAIINEHARTYIQQQAGIVFSQEKQIDGMLAHAHLSGKFHMCLTLIEYDKTNLAAAKEKQLANEAQQQEEGA